MRLTIEVDQAVADAAFLLHEVVKVVLNFFLNSSLPTDA
jgi:hypothetical protein